MESANRLVWIGLKRGINGWTWSDQSTSLTRVWASGEPSGGYMEYCASTDVNGWCDVNCDRKIPFICSGKHSNLMPVN